MPPDATASGAAQSGKVTDPEDDRKWTVMVFMGTHTVLGNAPLVQAAEDDIAEMKSVGLPPALNILVQVNGDDEPRRLHIGHKDEEHDVPFAEQGTANGNALKAFIRWANLRADHRPGDRSMLVLWGHAYQFAIGHVQHGDGSVDALDFAELVDVFSDFQEELRTTYGMDTPPRLDIVGFDACDVANMETAYQLRRFADYLLASEMGDPIPGWPYDRILDRLKTKQGDRRMGPAELGSYAVRRYCEAYQSEAPVSMTLLNLSLAEDAVARTEDLAQALAIAFAENPDERDLVFDLFVRSQTDDEKPFVDVADLCLNLMRESGNAMVRQAAQALGDFLISPKPVFPGHSATGEGRPFIAEHGRNAAKTAKLHGVSLYAPHIALAVDSDERETELRMYMNFAFAKESLWRQLVENLAELSLEA